MKFRRIVSVALILILFVVCFSFESFAVKIDGSFLDKEWKSAAQTVLVSTSDTANCDISYGMIYVYCDESASRIYIGFKAKATAKIDENSRFGAGFTADSGEFIYVTTDGVSAYNTDKYDVEAVAYAYSDSVYCVEVALGIKYGMSTVSSLRVRFVDPSGSPSNIYTVSVPDAGGSDSGSVTSPVNNNSGGSDVKAERTTKVKTTKAKTTKAKTTKSDKAESDVQLNNADSATVAQTTFDPYGEETTVITVREFKLQKGFTYAAVCALILLALGICLVINYSRDKEKSENSKKKVPEKKE